MDCANLLNISLISKQIWPIYSYMGFFQAEPQGGGLLQLLMELGKYGSQVLKGLVQALAGGVGKYVLPFQAAVQAVVNESAKESVLGIPYQASQLLRRAAQYCAQGHKRNASLCHLSLHHLAVLLIPVFGIIRIGHFQSTHFQ